MLLLVQVALLAGTLLCSLLALSLSLSSRTRQWGELARQPLHTRHVVMGIGSQSWAMVAAGLVWAMLVVWFLVGVRPLLGDLISFGIMAYHAVQLLGQRVRRRALYQRLVRDDFRVCTRCLYRLTGHDARGVCPECGQEFTVEDLRQRWETWLGVEARRPLIPLLGPWGSRLVERAWRALSVLLPLRYL